MMPQPSDRPELQSEVQIRAVPQPQDLRRTVSGEEFLTRRIQYQSLAAPDEIRILRLHRDAKRDFRDNGRAELGCELLHAKLSSSPTYTALSYAWGDLNDYRPIYLDGRQHIMVTRSLHEAIHRLSAEGEIYIWADQICINQQDLEERGSQVRLMGQIYASAARTFVWLGEADETADAAFALIEKLPLTGLNMPQLERLAETRDSKGLDETLTRCNIPSDGAGPAWGAMKLLSRRPWFSRLWTFQEFVLSRDVRFVCGKHGCPAASVIIAFYIFTILTSRGTSGMDNVGLLYTHGNAHAQRADVSMLYLLVNVARGRYHCLDPRDRVYSLLGLQTTIRPIQVEVDYTIPIADLYTRATEEVIRTSGCIDICSKFDPDTIDGLPSWVPDWTCTTFGLERLDQSSLNFTSSRGFRHVFEESPDKLLRVRGGIITRIAEVASHVFVNQDPASEQFDFGTFLGSDTLLPYLVKTLEGGVSRMRFRSKSKKVHCRRLVANTLTAGYFGKREHKAVFDPPSSDPGTEIIGFLQRNRSSYIGLVQVCLGRRVAILNHSKSPLGLVPESSQAGDYVCILNGARTPMVLRAAGDHFKLLGQCYVDGMMYGEAVTWKQDGGESCVLG